MAKTFKTVSGPKAKPTTKAGLPTVLENDAVRVEFRPKAYHGKPDITGDHKLDKFNEPRFFTKNVRGLDKQWAHLVAHFRSTTSYREVISLLTDAGAKVHDYCAMD